MTVKFYGAITPTGGTTGALDAIDGATLNSGDFAFVNVSNGQTWKYVLNASSSLTEDSTYYSVVTPDSNAGTKRWIRVFAGGRIIIPDSTVDQGAAATVGTLAWHITDIGSDDDTVRLMPGEYDLSTNESVPANVTLDFENGAWIDGSATLTVDSPFQVKAQDKQQVFGSSITVSFSKPGTVQANWWLIASDGATSDSASIQSAIDSLSVGGKVMIHGNNIVSDAEIGINCSGIVIEGDGADNERTAWGNFQTRIKWDGAITSNMFAVDSDGTGLIRGVGFKNMIIDGQDVSGIVGVRIHINASDGFMKNIIFRNVEDGILMLEGATGWFYNKVTVYDFEGSGWDLRDNNHRTTFLHCRVDNVNTTAADSGITIGQNTVGTHSSGVSIIGCDFEAKNTLYQIDAVNARGLSITGGYMEGVNASETAGIRLGRDAGTAVTGCSIVGMYFNAATYWDYVIVPDNVDGITIQGCDFRSYNTAAIASGTVVRGRYTGNYASDKVWNVANHSTGWDARLEFTLADDDFFNFTTVNQQGVLEVYCRNGATAGLMVYDLDTPATALLYNTADVAVTTGALAGTTGTNGFLTLSASATNDRLYIENRLGSSVDVVFTLRETVM